MRCPTDVSNIKKEEKVENSYKNEFVADLFATVVFGPAYFLSFLGTYGGVPTVARQVFRASEGIPWEKSHPSLENRFIFCIDVLERYLRYDDEVIKNLRNNLAPLFYYDGKTDPDDERQKKS
jgi:hypothetical protein